MNNTIITPGILLAISAFSCKTITHSNSKLHDIIQPVTKSYVAVVESDLYKPYEPYIIRIKTKDLKSYRTNPLPTAKELLKLFNTDANFSKLISKVNSDKSDPIDNKNNLNKTLKELQQMAKDHADSGIKITWNNKNELNSIAKGLTKYVLSIDADEVNENLRNFDGSNTAKIFMLGIKKAEQESHKLGVRNISFQGSGILAKSISISVNPIELQKIFITYNNNKKLIGSILPEKQHLVLLKSSNEIKDEIMGLIYNYFNQTAQNHDDDSGYIKDLKNSLD